MDIFKIGAQCGLKPDEVLDLSMDVFRVYVEGYSDRILDQKLISVQTGFWSAYFASKKPKSLKEIQEKIIQEHHKSSVVTPKRTRATDVDVETFLRREQQFNQYTSSCKGGG